MPYIHFCKKLTSGKYRNSPVNTLDLSLGYQSSGTFSKYPFIRQPGWWRDRETSNECAGFKCIAPIIARRETRALSTGGWKITRVGKNTAHVIDLGSAKIRRTKPTRQSVAPFPRGRNNTSRWAVSSIWPYVFQGSCGKFTYAVMRYSGDVWDDSEDFRARFSDPRSFDWRIKTATRFPQQAPAPRTIVLSALVICQKRRISIPSLKIYPARVLIYIEQILVSRNLAARGRSKVRVHFFQFFK